MSRRALNLVLLIVFTACHVDEATRSSAPIAGPVPAISDGGNGQGNPDFFFLPPLVEHPLRDPDWDPLGFDRTQRATVKICELAASTEQQINTQTPCKVGGYSVTFERVDADLVHYSVNWRVPQGQSTFYRISVHVGSKRLGFADVRTGRTLSELWSVNRREFIPLIGGNTVPIRFRIERYALCEPPGVGPCVKRQQVGSSGGTVSLDGSARFTFPVGFFVGSQSIEVARTQHPVSASHFAEVEGLYDVSGKLDYQVRVLAGSAKPDGEEFTAVMSVPASVVVPPGHRPQLFIQLYEAGGEEILDNFRLIPSIWNPSARTLTASVSVLAFTNTRRLDGLHEAIFAVATTPAPDALTAPNVFGRVAAAVTSSTCSVTPIASPLSGTLFVTRPFAIGTHPITGKPQTEHKGTDFRAATGTQALAVADGTVERVDFQIRADGTGWGRYLVLLHNDGNRSLYAHLDRALFTPNPSRVVSRGTAIALTNSTGGATGPHLHLEYIIKKGVGNVDPAPCITTAGVPGSSILDALGVATPTTKFSVFGSAGLSVLSSVFVGPEFVLTQPTVITEIGGFINNFGTCVGPVVQCPGTLPLRVQIRPSTNGVPDPTTVLGSFVLSHDNDVFVVSFESVRINLTLGPGRYFALFAPQGNDQGSLLNYAQDPFQYQAATMSLGFLFPQTGSASVESNSAAVRIMGSTPP